MNRDKLILYTSLLGFAVAGLSALEPHLVWLSNLCGFLGDGCREAESFTLFSYPVAYFGLGFYALLILLSLLKARQVFWPIMAGLGFEALLVRVMVLDQFFCVFCVLNLGIVLVLVLFSLRAESFWKSLSTALVSFLVLSFLFQGKNASPWAVEVLDRPAATVGDLPILHSELEAGIAGRLYTLRRDIHDLKKKALDQKIEAKLLALEARAQGITVQALTDQVYATARPVDFAQVARYYKENQARLAGRPESPEELNRLIAAFLLSESRSAAMQAFLAPLMDKYQVRTLLVPPPLPLAQVPVENSPSWGPKEAAVTIVEFSDYLCPSCRSAHAEVQKVKEKYQGRIRWIFKDFPLKRHKGADYMAAAARCAEEQGKFWEFQDLLFAYEGTDPGREEMLGLAQALGLDLDQFAQSLDSGRYEAAVEKDVGEAESAGISATPTFIINGRMHPGSLSLEGFSQIIDEELSP